MLSALQIERLMQEWEGAPSPGVAVDRRELRHLLNAYLQHSRRPESKKATSRRNDNSRVRLKNELTGREHEVLKLIRSGYSNNEISAKLKINLNTVKTHSKSIFSKLGVKSRTQAAIKSLGDDRQID